MACAVVRTLPLTEYVMKIGGFRPPFSARQSSFMVRVAGHGINVGVAVTVAAAHSSG